MKADFKQIRKAAQTVQNVVTYTVLVSAANESGQLLPGMTANVRIVIETRDSVLKVSNAALRFRPPGEAAAVPDKAGAEKGAANTPSAAAGGGQGQGAQFRERLITELKLDIEQQAQLDPILAEMRNKLMGVRDLPEESRAKAAAAARADVRAKIEAILRPEQKTRYAEIAAEQAGRSGQSARGRVWVLEGGKPKAIDVRVGLTDGAMSEVSGAAIAEGSEVIVGLQSGTAGAPAQKAASPRMFF